MRAFFKWSWFHVPSLVPVLGLGFEPNTVHGTIHGPGYSGAGGIGAAYSGPNFSDRSITWTASMTSAISSGLITITHRRLAHSRFFPSLTAAVTTSR